MKSGEGRRIGIIDISGRQAELVRASLLSSGQPRLLQDSAELTASDVELVVVHAPGSSLDASRLRTIQRAAGTRPLLVLGTLPEGEWAGVVALEGSFSPARLEKAIASLQASARAESLRSLGERIAQLVPMAAGERLRLLRLLRAGLPVLFVGEPGTGKSLLARTFPRGPASIFHRIELPAAGALATEPLVLAPRGRLYLALLEDLPLPDIATLRQLLERALDGEFQLALGTHDVERALARLPDDLRLWLRPSSVSLAPLRLAPASVPALFRELGALFAAAFAMESPVMPGTLDARLQSWPWPLNYEELLACVRRALVAVEERPLSPEDLGLPELPPLRAVPGVSEIEARDPVPLSPSPELGSLVQELAHEIRNPLVSVKTFTQLLPERFDDAEFRDQYHRLVAADVERIDAVLGELDEYSRLPAGRPEPVEVAGLLQRALEGQQFLLRKRALEVVSRIPEHWGAIHSDPLLLGYAFDNLLREAVAAMPEGTRLEVSPLPARSGRANRSRGLVFRYRIAPDSPAAARVDRERRPREVIGLRHALADRVLRRLGGGLAIEDTLEGETRVTVTFDDRP